MMTSTWCVTNDFHTIKVRRKGDEIRAFWGGKDLKKPYSNPKGREDKLDEREVENRNPGFTQL